MPCSSRSDRTDLPIDTINRKVYKLFCCVIAMSIALFSGCASEESPHKFQRYTLGTYVQLQIYSSKHQADEFIKQFDQLSKKQTKDLYAWGDGWLTVQNRFLENAQCGLPVDDDSMVFFQKLKDLHAHSSGLFDPAIMPLVELWGFHKSEEMRSVPPTDEEIESLMARYGNMQDIELHDRKICAKRPLKVDLGGVAKGWAAQQAFEMLYEHGINNALIGFGGDLIALGHKPDGSPWKVGLKNPDIHSKGFDAPAIFTLDKRESSATAVFTSGDYERQFEYKGKRSHHILDPRSGYPNTAIRSVTVIHSDPILADAAATALHVAGEDWQNIAKQMKVENVLVLFPNKKAQITNSMNDLTSWQDPDYKVEVIAQLNSTY